MPLPHVLILGAGLSGLTLAQCLRKQDISFEIFERDAGLHGRPESWPIALQSYVRST
jgi:2-polyprenyl-6-methoxyphenol hydroxylase-like FAD-dependent oxidoreductase